MGIKAIVDGSHRRVRQPITSPRRKSTARPEDPAPSSARTIQPRLCQPPSSEAASRLQFPRWTVTSVRTEKTKLIPRVRISRSAANARIGPTIFRVAADARRAASTSPAWSDVPPLLRREKLEKRVLRRRPETPRKGRAGVALSQRVANERDTQPPCRLPFRALLLAQCLDDLIK